MKHHTYELSVLVVVSTPVGGGVVYMFISPLFPSLLSGRLQVAPTAPSPQPAPAPIINFYLDKTAFLVFRSGPPEKPKEDAKAK